MAWPAWQQQPRQRTAWLCHALMDQDKNYAACAAPQPCSQTRVERPANESYLGLLGPVLRAAVGQTVTVHLRNALSFNVSLVPTGGLKQSPAGAGDGADMETPFTAEASDCLRLGSGGGVERLGDAQLARQQTAGPQGAADGLYTETQRQATLLVSHVDR